MDFKAIINFVLFAVVTASDSSVTKNDTGINGVPDNVFNGVYSECFLHLSYSCLQKKTLLYLKELNNLNEVSVIGEYVKFVRIKSDFEGSNEEDTKSGDTEELAFMIDKAIDNFFDNHVLKFYALGRNISVPRNEEFVGRKKRKGGGGGGGHDSGGHDDGGKKKMMMMAMMCMKMKLMMMVPAMMGMMGMMSFKGMMFSMMSFMISKMMLLMKILEKKGGLGGAGGSGGLDGGWAAAGGGGGGAWMPAGGQDYGGGGGGGYDANGQWQSRSIVETSKTYKTIEDIAPKKEIPWHNGRNGKEPVYFQSVAIDQWKGLDDPNHAIAKPDISFVKPMVRIHNKVEESDKKPVLVYKRSNVNFEFDNTDNSMRQIDEDVLDPGSLRRKRDLSNKYLKEQQQIYPNNERNSQLRDEYNTDREKVKDKVTSKDFVSTNIYSELKHRQKRGLLDLLQNAYMYWTKQLLGTNMNRRTNFQRYKIINGVKYVYYPYKIQKPKMPKQLPVNSGNNIEDLGTGAVVEDFNKGEIVENGVGRREEESRTHKKFHKMKDTVNDTMDDNPWE